MFFKMIFYYWNFFFSKKGLKAKWESLGKASTFKFLKEGINDCICTYSSFWTKSIKKTLLNLLEIFLLRISKIVCFVLAISTLQETYFNRSGYSLVNLYTRIWMAMVFWECWNCLLLSSFVVTIDDFSQTDVLSKSLQPSYAWSLEQYVNFYFCLFFGEKTQYHCSFNTCISILTMILDV